jgi:phosphoadenosine phosphosulfate reductase
VSTDIKALIASDALETKTAAELMAWAGETFGTQVSLASSFGAEDVVLIDIIARSKVPITIFTLDTGRLNQETYDVIDRIAARYEVTIDTYAPDASDVESMVREHGCNLFYASIAHRKRCCGVRKVAPLTRALMGRQAWMTGLRREQVITRAGTKKLEWDEAHQLYKINPLADWTEAQVWEHIKQHNVPYNALHDQGYPSIGCAPCTRAVQPGEDPRGGRWWWENPDQKECGLHVKDH